MEDVRQLLERRWQVQRGFEDGRLAPVVIAAAYEWIWPWPGALVQHSTARRRGMDCCLSMGGRAGMLDGKFAQVGG